MVPAITTNKGISMSAWAPIHGSLNYYNNHLQIQPTTYVRDDQSLVLDRQSELRINTELNSTIKRFEEVSEKKKKEWGESGTQLFNFVCLEFYTDSNYKRY